MYLGYQRKRTCVPQCSEAARVCCSTWISWRQPWPFGPLNASNEHATPHTTVYYVPLHAMRMYKPGTCSRCSGAGTKYFQMKQFCWWSAVARRWIAVPPLPVALLPWQRHFHSLHSCNAVSWDGHHFRRVLQSFGGCRCGLGAVLFHNALGARSTGFRLRRHWCLRSLHRISISIQWLAKLRIHAIGGEIVLPDYVTCAKVSCSRGQRLADIAGHK